MKHEIVIAGFGGQGVLLLGQMLAYGGMMEGKHVSWFPSYGPEMRGGTANCTVVISDEEIGSPVVSEPSCVIAMNRPSLDKFEDSLQSNGLLLLNQSLIDREPARSDVKTILVPATAVADELGTGRVANMVLLGSFVAATGALSTATLENVLKKVLPEHRHNLIPLNMEAITRGEQIAKDQ